MSRGSPGPHVWRELEKGQTARLCTFDVRSGAAQLVHETFDAVIEAPNWTSDGTFLVFNREGRLYRIAPREGAEPEVLDTGGIEDANNDHVLSPDGRFVYITSRDGHIYEVPMGGGKERRVTNSHPHPFRHYLHGISPDGKTLVYTGAQEVNGNPYGALNIFTLLVAGGADLQLTHSEKPEDGAEYSPDGAWIYFNSEMASSVPGHAQVFRMRPDGTEMAQLTDDERVNWFPHLSPNGARLIYLSYAPGTVGHPANKDVIVRSMSPDGGEREDLLHLYGGQGTMNVNGWAPDSLHFAFVEYPIFLTPSP